jgi:hypothetical protein
LVEQGSPFDTWRSSSSGEGSDENDEGPLYAWEVEAVVPLQGNSSSFSVTPPPPLTSTTTEPPPPAPLPPPPLPETSVVDVGGGSGFEEEKKEKEEVLQLPRLQRRLRSLFEMSWPSREVDLNTTNSNNPFASERTVKAEVKAKKLALAAAAAAEEATAAARSTNVHGRAPVVATNK